MRCSSRILTAAVSIALGLLAGCETTTKIASRTYHILPFTGKPAPAPAGTASKRTQSLTLKMQVSPVPVKLSDARQIEIRIRLENISRKFVQLEFPTTQRIEILIRDETGRQITQWSDARTFEPVAGFVGINPGEHVEYSTSVSTRDLQPGRKYTVVGFFPNFEKLTAEETIVPER